MPGPTYVLDKTYKCGVALGVAQYLAVGPDTDDGEVKLPATAGDPCEGIAQEAGVVDKNFRVRVEGISKAIAGENITTKRTALIADIDGKLIAATLTATGAAVAVQHIIGYNLDLGDDGKVITVELVKGLVIRPVS